MNKYTVKFLEILPWLFWFGVFCVITNGNWVISGGMAIILYILNKLILRTLDKVKFDEEEKDDE